MFSKTFLAAAATFAVALAQDAPPELAAALNSTEELSQLNTLLGGFPDREHWMRSSARAQTNQTNSA